MGFKFTENEDETEVNPYLQSQLITAIKHIKKSEVYIMLNKLGYSSVYDPTSYRAVLSTIMDSNPLAY